MISSTPQDRVRRLNRARVHTAGHYVLYWMTSFRRLEHNFSLQRAVDWCRELKSPLIILEVLRADYPCASARLHQFVLDGILERLENWGPAAALYYPFVERQAGDQKGLLRELAGSAQVVVTDDFPCFFIPQMLEAASESLPVLLEAIDSNGVMPLSASSRAFSRAYHFRRHLQQNLPAQLVHSLRDPLSEMPDLKASLPSEIYRKWPPPSIRELRDPGLLFHRLGFARGPKPAPTQGGSLAGRQLLRRFIEEKLDNYEEQRNRPDLPATSGLSPYLHFGFVSSDEVFQTILQRSQCVPGQLEEPRGKVEDWWPPDSSSCAFLDQLLTWRELGFNFCHQRPDYSDYDSLPNWALKTLAEHEEDTRSYSYEIEEFESAQTHDPIWNAAQNQLVEDGVIHNYLRMLWGKKILEWTRSPRQALEIMLELNNRYALDGRDPNSYSGIFWCLGRFDRAWGPERPIFGKIRYMSSQNTARKLRLKPYLDRYSKRA